MRLLVVEDEARLATALQRGLQAEGFAVDIAADGLTGLELARHGGYDAMILDVMLPRLSGYRVVRALRAEGHWLPVLMLSAKDGEHDQADGLDCGADDYLTKPFSYVVLLARLRALLRRGAPERPTVLTVGEVTLDPASRRVTVAGEEVTLTTREYGLLQYLMRRPGHVVSKTELLDHVWDASEQTAPNAVEVYVGYLRRKLGRDVVETVRGRATAWSPPAREVVWLKDWWRRRTLRARLMIIGVTGLTLGFVAGGLALALVLGIVLQRSVDAEIDATARHVAELVEANALPVPIPVPAGDLAQVIDSSGRVVVGASADADPLWPMVSPDELARLRAGERLTVNRGEPGYRGGPLRMVAVVAGPPEDPRTVVVARSMVDATRGLGLLRTHLFVVFPLLLLASALVAWRAIGATLRPVEQLRRGAEEITGSGPRSAGRLPVPAGDDEIHRLAVTLNDMLDRLEAGRARQREFVADAAHELRSPLANMRTQLEVARHLGPAADWPAVGEDLLIDTNRLARLVDDLLVLARADTSPQPARDEPVDLAALTGDVASRTNGGTPVTVLGDAPVWTVGDPDELRRVVGNLVDNAVRYARTRVRLSVGVEGGAALLAVTDDGPGIPFADRERVFERFTRLDDSRTHATGGAGLGLAIVRELVRRHRGMVTLTDAEPGEPSPGLRVEVRLRLGRPPEPDGPPDAASVIGRSDDDGRRGR